ncbi:MAG TPA: OmpH family outer membrane protein [Bryobacteraceae bacterium]|nr:OmpH family outer membrane protein [Bryobacteraceae bacterium]
MLLVLSSVGIVSAQTAAPFQPVKVAVLNAQKAVADTAELKKVQAALETKYRPTENQIQALQQDLQSIQTQLNSGSQLTPDKESQLRATGTQKQRQLQRLNEDLQADLNSERQDILGRAGRQMTEIVRKIAEAHGVDVVIDISNTLYFKPALDITAEATTGYDKAYPPK